MILRWMAVPVFFFLSTAHAFECSKFKADGFYDVNGTSVLLTFLSCDLAILKDQSNNIDYQFTLDGKTHTDFPNAFYAIHEKRIRDDIAQRIQRGENKNSIPAAMILEKVTYTSRMAIDDDGAAVHLDVTALVKPENNKGIQRFQVKGHAAIYLRERNRRKDCAACPNPADLFEKDAYLQVWLGNAEITKVEGGSKKDAELLLLDAMRKAPPYQDPIPFEDKDKQAYGLSDLILVEKFHKQTNRSP